MKKNNLKKFEKVRKKGRGNPKRGGKPGGACAHPRVQHYQHVVLLL